MIILKIITSVLDVFLALISMIALIGGRMKTEEQNAMLFCLVLAIANIFVIWGQI